MTLFRTLLIATLVFTASLSAQAEQQQNAYAYLFWKTTSANTYTKLEQRVQITQKAPYSFWASSWGWNDTGSGGYIGLQTNGNRVDGSVGDTVIFSVWNATAANGSCQTFGGEGVGYSCRLAYAINTTQSYTLRVEKGASASDGQWWNAYIKNVSTGVESKIGSLRAAATNTSLQLPNNFSEYFGPAVPTCSDVPVSVATWYQASLKPVNSYLSVKPTYSSYSVGACTGGSVVSTTQNFTPVVKVTLGGAR